MTRMSLPPGFRFHPTDVELIKYYLKRKALGKRLRFEAIAEINVYKYSPSDLPDKSCLKNKDLEWFFFCPVSRKYASGARSSRATESGYWKSTGKDRAIMHNEKTVGMIKTLVFHQGHAPKGDRTDWVMHEYRISENELVDAGIDQAAYVLVKVFKKSGLGPRNGAQYGAPFNEEEWDIDSDDEIQISAQNLQPSDSIPLSAVANNHTGSVVTNTFFYGSTSASPLDNLPLSAVTNNNDYYVAPTQSESPSLTTVTPNYCNSIDTSSFFQGSMSTVAHNNRNSNITDIFLPGGAFTGPSPKIGPSTTMSSANDVILPIGAEVDLESLLAMFIEDDPPMIPSDLNNASQVNVEEFIELDDIYSDLGNLDDWEELRRMI